MKGIQIETCNCCGANTTPVEDRRDEDGWYYCTICVVLASYDDEEYLCVLCDNLILTGELCSVCAKGNDPFFTSKYTIPRGV